MTKLYGSGVIAQEVVQYDGDGNVVSPGAITSITLPTAIYNGQETVDSAGTAQAIGSSQALTSGVKCCRKRAHSRVAMCKPSESASARIQIRR